MLGSRWRALAVLGSALLLIAACSGAAARPLHVRLDAGPAVAAFVTPVHVSVNGLPPGGLVTVRARARDYQHRQWESSAVFRASRAGTLNLATAKPVSGSYHVADAAGLLWSLRPVYTRSPAQFFMTGTGFSVTLQVLVNGAVVAHSTLIRSAANTTSVQTVRKDGFASTLFSPLRPARHAPVIVVIGGSEGGEDTFLASALASIGYPALALGYFKEPGLPRCLCDIPLEYFARAVRWLRDQPVARSHPLMLYGVSRGGEGALLIASLEPHLFSAVIASSPNFRVFGQFGDGAVGADAAWTWHGHPLRPGLTIPVDAIRVPLLMGDGGLDAIWDSELSVRFVVSELQSSHDHAPYINLFFANAGHAFLGTPPYFPYAVASARALGGSTQANALADEQSWARMIEFINDPWRS